MSRGEFFANPDFIEYVELLSQLHELIASDADETPRGEALRDRMDDPGERLSAAEIQGVKRISADFYTLTTTPTSGPPPAIDRDEARAEIRSAVEARDRGDFQTALTLLRKHAASIPPGALAYMRGTIWKGAGLLPVALRFYRRAVELEPGNDGYRYLEFECLEKTDPAAARRRATDVLEDPGEPSVPVRCKAVDVLLQAADELPDDEARPERRRLARILDDLVVSMQMSAVDRSNPSLLANALAQAGINQERLGDVDAARAYFDRGLARFPTNDGLLAARGALLYGRDTERALRDFDRAIQGDTGLVLPYFHMAHHALRAERFGDCLDWCQRGLRRHGSPNVVATLLEWTAVSQASLGFPDGAVKANFEAAIQYDPNNDRIRNNYRLFDSMIAGRPPEWDVESEEGVRRLRGRLEPTAA